MAAVPTIARTLMEPSGSKIHATYDLTFTSVTGGEVATGLNNILFAAYSPTLSDDHGILYFNYSDAGTTSARGSVYIDSVTSNDTGSLYVIGN